MSSSALSQVRKDLKKQSSKRKAKVLARFFKTGPGEYAAGDIFIGVMVPDTRTVALGHAGLSLKDTAELLKSKIHEERLTALLILIAQFRRSGPKNRKKIYQIYLKNTRHINNWDLVDLSAEHIVGAYLSDKDKKILYALARSKMLWERRIAILATFHFIRNQKFSQTLKIAKILLTDEEDLIHKAVGWLLREVGKRDMALEEEFLKKYYPNMPRTMLRYAIERFPERRRQAFLKGRT
ncbi:DNA alkylation repair protein [Candidatus Omnitrophota bacterium]